MLHEPEGNAVAAVATSTDLRMEEKGSHELLTLISHGFPLCYLEINRCGPKLHKRRPDVCPKSQCC